MTLSIKVRISLFLVYRFYFKGPIEQKWRSITFSRYGGFLNVEKKRKKRTDGVTRLQWCFWLLINLIICVCQFSTKILKTVLNFLLVRVVIGTPYLRVGVLSDTFQMRPCHHFTCFHMTKTKPLIFKKNIGFKNIKKKLGPLLLNQQLTIMFFNFCVMRDG